MNPRALHIAVGLLIPLVLLAGTAAAEAGSRSPYGNVGNTTVSVNPVADQVAPGERTTLQIKAAPTEKGISAFKLDFSLNTTTAKFTDYEVPASGSPSPLVLDRYSSGNTALSVHTALLGASHSAGKVATLANITLKVSEPGAIGLSITHAEVLADTKSYNLYRTALSNSTVTGIKETSPPPVSMGRLPKDPDGDGLYEDVNGDGLVNTLDVQALFTNLDSPVVQQNAAAFDFSPSGPSSEVTVLDVQEFFK
jgi:hypothetical protein